MQTLRVNGVQESPTHEYRWLFVNTVGKYNWDGEKIINFLTQPFMHFFTLMFTY